AEALLHELQVHQVELEMQNEELRCAQLALDASHARYVELYDQAPVGYCSLDAQGRILQANLHAAELLGMSRPALCGVHLTRFVAAVDQDRCYLQLRALLRDGRVQTHEMRMQRPDGRQFWAQHQMSMPPQSAAEAPLTGTTGAFQRSVLLVITDISARRQTEESLKLAASVFTHAREGIMITEPDGTIVNVNEAFCRITGFEPSEVLGRNPRLLKSNLHDLAFYEAMWAELLQQGHCHREIWNRRKNGEVYAIAQTISAVRDAQGRIEHFVSLFSDVTVLKAHEDQLKHIAHFDALTHLPNRILLADRLHQAMSQAQRRGQMVAVAFLDLDGFKAVNDRYGHGVGDQMLVALADRMQEAMRDGDTLARLGGDEFVAVLSELSTVSACVPVLTRLLAAAAQPWSHGALQLQLSASLGVTFFPQLEDIDADQLLRQADQAMYQAKLAGKNRYHIFDAEHDRSVRGLHESLQRIRAALRQQEFLLVYQPKVDMRANRVVGAEALIRWQHPERGLLPPLVFLPMIEDHVLAVELGEWVIAEALRQIMRWRSQGLVLPVSVNVGARQLQQADFVDRLRALLAEQADLPPGLLTIEVLETSALEDVQHVSQVIEACKGMGVEFALDDFGTGYSSLTYLKRLPVAQLKIDQSFVRDMLDNPVDLAILQGVIGMARAFRCEVIAEGVETHRHSQQLLALGCELAQGYGIARPMAAALLPDWVEAWTRDPRWLA
ncbi:MAG: EAL domain-containing protein, partial [Paucibacter sp.]|nr:EAL domain-containing protein [Roseateles sp.]